MASRGHAADIRLFVAHDPLLLLERAADSFLVPARSTPESPFPSPPYLLALRQGGLRDDLMALARERDVPGWFDPPLCVFRELPDYLGATSRKPLDDFERAVLLASILRDTPGEVFARLHRPDDFVAALDTLFGELIGEGTTPEEWRTALESRPDRDAFDRKRDAELALLYKEYVTTLNREQRRDGRDTWLDCAAALAADPAALSARLGGRREIRILGLQDLRGGWRPLLRALRASPALDHIGIYTAGPLDLGPGLDAQVTPLGEPETAATRLFGPPAPDAVRAASPVRAIVAPDAEREVEEVARRVRALAESGAPLGRIAVVARQARPYVDLLLAALDRLGVPAWARRRTSLAHVPAVKALRSLLDAAAGGWERHALVELAEQPYFAVDLDARVLNAVGYRTRIRGLPAWRAALEALLQESKREEERRARGEEEKDDHHRPPPAVWRVEKALRGFSAFAEHAAALDGQRPLAEWVRLLEALLEQDPWRLRERIYRVPADRFDVARVDLRAWTEVEGIVRRWREALDRWRSTDEPIGVAAFSARVGALLEGDVALVTGNRRGVPVLEALAATSRSFDHVFLVGLESGRFPRRAPVSPILDERDRAELARAGLRLEPREAWDARERELFRSLVAGARRGLTVSWARLDPAGRDVVRSAFVDALEDVALLQGAGKDDEIPASQVVTEGVRLWTGAAGREQALHAAQIEWQRLHRDLSIYGGEIRDPALLSWLAREFGDERLWSPTQLESYAKCPWAYFSARLLRLEKLEDPEEEMDPATRGSVRHEALRRFYDRARERAGGPVYLREADLAWAVPDVVAALDEALAEAGARGWVGHPALLPPKRAELIRMLKGFIEAEVEEHEASYTNRGKARFMIRTGADAHEVRIANAILERDGVRVRFCGSIDRVEVGVDERIDRPDRFTAAVDYKSSVWSTPGVGKPAAWDDGVVLQVPLYAHALTQLRPKTDVARTEYRALRPIEPAHQLQLRQYDPKRKVVLENPEQEAQMERALDDVIRHVRAIRDGKFPVRPPESCKCSPYCHALDICRIPGGPTFKNPKR